MRTWRLYGPRWRRFAVVGLVLAAVVGTTSLVLFLVALVLFLESHSPAVTRWGLLLPAIAMVCTAIAMVSTGFVMRVLRRARTTATSEWIEVHTGWRARRLPWERVRAVRAVRMDNRVVLELGAGEELQLPGVKRSDVPELEALRTGDEIDVPRT